QGKKPPFPYVVFSKTYPQTIYKMPTDGNYYLVVTEPQFTAPIEQEFVILTMLTYNNYTYLDDIQIVYANQYSPGIYVYNLQNPAVGFEYGYTTPGGIPNYYGAPFNIEPKLHPYMQTIIPSLKYGQQFYVGYIVITAIAQQNTSNQPPPMATLSIPRLILVML
ncbi:MAG: hypothetical protein QXG57_09045, partial [Thermofilaceae archaeon]